MVWNFGRVGRGARDFWNVVDDFKTAVPVVLKYILAEF